ncbi:MAG TPA: hypothetical protein VL099_09275 [Candidatus Binatia bacterium]|nr:hypothetical protein [Candidatus Binatia bacterium]
MLRDLVLLALLAVLAFIFPKTVLGIEGICGLGTLALFLVERGMTRKW